MLVRITNKCFMECDHCMNESDSNGDHMTDDIYTACLDFISKYENKIFISGGEPTEHPCFIDYVKIAQEHGFNVQVGSNGMFFNKSEEYINQIMNLNADIWVTHDPKFYKKSINIPVKYSSSKLLHIEQVYSIKNFGRAAVNNIATDYSSHWCDDFREKIYKHSSFKVAMQKRHYSCRPSISINGDITMGCTSCCCIGNIWSDDDELLNNVLQIRSYC